MVTTVLLALFVGAVVLFVTFGPIMRRGTSRFDINVHALEHPSGRLRFRHPGPNDVSFLEGLYEDPVAIEANFWDDESLEQTRSMLRDPELYGPWCSQSLLAIDVDTLAPVALGTLGVEQADGRHGLSIGLQVAADQRGKGYATESLAAMIAATRAATDVEIWVGTSITNHPVLHMMERLGSSPEAGSAPYTAPDGTLVESRWYRVGGDTPDPRFP